MGGRGPRPVRHRAVIATKFGFGVEEGAPEPRTAVPTISGARWRVRYGGCAQTISIFYQHRWAPGAHGRCGRNRGGAHPGGQGQAFRAVRGRGHPFAGRMPFSRWRCSEYAALVARAGNKIFATLRELGIGFVPYCPVGRGFLTESSTKTADFVQADRRSTLPRFTPEALKRTCRW